MRPFRTLQRFLIYTLIFAALLMGRVPFSSAQRAADVPPVPQEQIGKLQEILKMESPVDRNSALDNFFKQYPDTPMKADVYRIKFLSLKEFSKDDAQLWHIGKQFVDAVTVLADTKMMPFTRGPVIAQAYNEVSYTFAERGTHLDEALSYAQQALSLIQQAVRETPPNIPAEQWREQLDPIRGQILDTVGWLQYRRGLYPDAEKAVTDALQFLPELGAVHYHLGMIREAQGQTDKAIDSYLNGMTVENADPEAKKAADRIFRKKYGNAAEMQMDTRLQAARTRAQARKMRSMVENRLNVDAPGFTLSALNGTPVSLSSLQGKVVVINFWATWCSPCREEMPALEKLWSTYKTNRDVIFLIASVDEEREKVKPYIQDNRYTFPVYFAGESARAYQVGSIPTTCVIDGKGKIQFMHVGYRPDIGEVLGWQIDTLISER